jgi:hypothetical protein
VQTKPVRYYYERANPASLMAGKHVQRGSRHALTGSP